MSKKAANCDSGGQDFVSVLMEDLKSRGVVEQLRLECVADVKKKATYLQLKERINDYVTKKMSSEAWTSDNSFIQQVVECGVLALTIERVVDEVVSRKLQEEMRPLLINLIKEEVDGATVSKLKIYKSNAAKRGKRSSNTSFEKTVKVVRTICSDTKRNYKLLKDGLVAHSLASMSFSKSAESEDENLSMSVSSTNISDLSCDSDSLQSDNEKKNKSSAINTESGVVSRSGFKTAEPPSRSRRERKLNPKYSSGVYQTSLLSHLQNLPLVTSTPKKEKTENTLTNGNSSRKSKMFRKCAKHEEHRIRKILHKGSENEEERSSSYVRKEYVEQSFKTTKPTTVQKQNRYLETHSEVAINDAVINGSVRKSGRQRKMNSRIFRDSLPPYTTKGLRKLFPVNKIENECSSSKLLKDPVISDVEQIRKSKVTHDDTPVSSPKPSTKRYKSSDLYKPHLSSSARTKRAHVS